MKTIYYVTQKQLDNVDGFEETNGWKNVRAYEVQNGKLVSVAELEIENSDNTEKELLQELEDENIITTRVNLIQL